MIVPDVNFEFRFHSNLRTHEAMQAVRVQLAHAFGIDRAGPSYLKMQLYPVARAGKSGSEVFYLDLFKTGVSYPARFIAKFQNRISTRREKASALEAQHAGLCTSVFTNEHATEDLGIIVYDLARCGDHVEFRGYFLNLNQSNARCAEALSSIFKLVGRHPNGDSVRKPLVDDFAWYVDRKAEPLQKLASFVDPDVTRGTFPMGVLAEEILNFYERIKMELNVQVSPYLVHGDLHARNLMLNETTPSRSELIDFGWVHYGHPAKDFVLMETTLKYMLLPELLPIARGASRDPLHVSTELMWAFEDFVAAHGFELPPEGHLVAGVFAEKDVPPHQQSALLRVYSCLVELRRSAGVVLREYCVRSACSLKAEQHYLICLFLVTLGSLGFEEIDRVWALIGLRSTGEFIWKI